MSLRKIITVEVIIAALAVALFCSSYWICNLIFPDNPVLWWDLRMALTTVIYALCFTSAYVATKGVIRAIFLTGLVFCGGDILDRYLFSINSFQWNDLLLYIFALYHIYTVYARETKTDP